MCYDVFMLEYLNNGQKSEICVDKAGPHINACIHQGQEVDINTSVNYIREAGCSCVIFGPC